MYTYSEVFNESIKYFDGDEFAAKVFVDKYALKTPQEEYLELTPTDMHHRLAKEFARIESYHPNPLLEDEIFSLFEDFKYIVPQGSPMSAIGNPYKLQSLSNCFVIAGVNNPSLDSYGGILLADQELAQIMKRRGGVGLDISGIRPKGAVTANSAGTTDGIAIFMERFSNTCREVAQNGRRGALMQTLSINHPEIETFINIKRDLKKVTGANISIRLNDAFMNAVKNNEDYVLRYPVDASIEDAKITKTVKAIDIWNQIVDSAWTSAEPGLLFWDACIENTPSDIYKDFGHASVSTNPCLSGDTLIAVADGRNAVSIKQLADEGKDVAVYSFNKQTGVTEIKMGRNPRITGFNQKLLRVTLDDNSYLDTTPNHKFTLLNGDTVEAKDLTSGDSLPPFKKFLKAVKKGSKDYYAISTNVRDAEKVIFEHRLISKFYNPEQWENTNAIIKNNGFAKTGGLVVHHKDYDQLNNAPDNLQVMTFSAHSKHHGELDQKGEKNGMYSGFTKEQIKAHALEFTKSLGRRFSSMEWHDFAKTKGLPVNFSKFRKEQMGELLDLARLCAVELNIEHGDSDPRLVRTYNSMIKQGYNARIDGKVVLIKNNCKKCNSEFEVNHLIKDQEYCTIKCLGDFINSDPTIHDKRKASRDKYLTTSMLDKKVNQARIYSKIKFELKRTPMMKEWEDACKIENVPYRVGKKLRFCFKNYQEVIEAGDNYNHKVLKVEELEGEHTVYNITVDDNHTFAVITNSKAKGSKLSYSGIYTNNCGELLLPIADSCRLTAINLSSYVNFPFTSLATFDFDKFHKHTIIAQRLMDDVVQLEIESVDKIIAKIKSDPESDEVKRTELNLWNKIREMAVSGRRTGLGITALGDALAMLNIKYGSKESIEMTGKIYKALAVGSHTSSCILAKERGAFPIFNYELERKHKYISKIMEACGEEVVEMWKTTGRRSIANTTTAPTGSVSAETQTTSGIEPAFLLSYVRRKKHNPSDKNARVDFTDEMGDKWQEFIVYHHGVKQWMDVTKETDISKSPYWGATSNEIDWVASVEMQAAAQDWTDHCLSKTCVTKDALIETDKGLFYMDELISFDETKTLENNDILVKNCNYDFVKPSHMHILKESNLIELELENGLSIKVTPKERFMCDGKWEYIESLNIGDKIKVSK